MMKMKKVLVFLAVVCVSFLVACSSQPSKNADGTPSTLKSRYLGYYSSDTDNATYFDELTNEFDFDVEKSTISDGTGIDSHIKEYQVLEEDELASHFQGQAIKNKEQVENSDVVFYIGLMSDDGNGDRDGKISPDEQRSVYQIVLSNDGTTIKIISLGDGWDQFVFTGTAKE
ncbi:TPA: hypothetical protein U1C40_000095 [Streptococcus suis]|nr:hypothetical protein [Streptococcus suis]